MGKLFRILLLLLLLILLAAFLVKTCKRDTGRETGLEIAYPSRLDSHDRIVKHHYFHLAYSEENEQASWALYLLTRQMVEKAEFPRKDNFREDPFVLSGSASPDDYRKSGYDRGHLVPAADMKFSALAMDETFFMSNITPQNRKFNSGIWKELEEKVRDWALREDSLLIVTGPVLARGNLGFIGENGVAVPRYFYKVILDITGPEPKGIAFIMENKGGQKNMFDYAVSIDSAESFTGLDFFYKLQRFDMDAIEGKLETELWKKH